MLKSLLKKILKEKVNEEAKDTLSGSSSDEGREGANKVVTTCSKMILLVTSIIVLLVLVVFFILQMMSNLLLQTMSPAVLSFPFTVLQDTYGVDLGITSVSMSGGSYATGTKNAVAGERYQWDELAKLNTVSDSYLQNLYKLCMLNYQALTDLQVTQRQRMDTTIGFFKIEAGSFKGVSDILTDLVSIDNGQGYLGVYQINKSYPKNGTGAWNWVRYKYKDGGRHCDYVPDATYWTVSSAADLYNQCLEDGRTDVTGHYYGYYLKQACEKYGLNWNDDKIKADLTCCYIYVKHAGGNWNDDWAVASADFCVYMYVKVLNKDYGTLKVSDVSALDSSVMQLCGIELNDSVPSVFTINGKPITQSMYQIYAADTANTDNAKAIRNYRLYGNNIEFQACMSLTVSTFLPATGQALQMQALKAIGYTESDIAFDDLGYACYAKTTETTQTTTATGGEKTYEDNIWATFVVSPTTPSYADTETGKAILDILSKDNNIGTVAKSSLDANTNSTNTTVTGETDLVVGGAVSTLANGKLTEVPESFLNALSEAMQNDLGSDSYGRHHSDYYTGIGYRTFYQASDGAHKTDGYWARTLGRFSEHCVGLAIDFLTSYNGSGSINSNGHTNKSGSQEPNLEFKWLADNAHKYGFIWRYKINGSDTSCSGQTTGTIYEGWHWRFVGVYHATKFWEKCAIDSDGDGILDSGYETNDNYIWEDYQSEYLSNSTKYPQTALQGLQMYANNKGNICTYQEYQSK